jgi:hypothetical protein
MNPKVSKRAINRQRWHERIEAWRKSAQSQQAFCEAHHLGLASFRRWHRRFRAEGAVNVVRSTEPVHFLPVQIHKPAPSPLTIRLQDDLRIEIPEGFDATLLRQVIQILRSA